MYNWLNQKFGRQMANIVIYCWYVLLIALCFYLAGYEVGSFRYMNW